MPTYEYKREDGSTFEIIQKMSDDALKVCPTTGQKVKRIISGGSGVLYKGDGFYITDYKNGKTASITSEDKSTSSIEEKPKESKTTESTASSKKENGSVKD